MGALAEAQNRGCARHKAELRGVRFMAGRDAFGGAFAFVESSPRREAHHLREDVRQADILDLDLLVLLDQAKRTKKKCFFESVNIIINI